jgi:hypothetical protein
VDLEKLRPLGYSTEFPHRALHGVLASEKLVLLEFFGFGFV